MALKIFEVMNLKQINTAKGVAETAVVRNTATGEMASAISYLYRGKEYHCNNFHFKFGMKIATTEEISSEVGKNGKIYNKIKHFFLSEEIDDICGNKPQVVTPATAAIIVAAPKIEEEEEDFVEVHNNTDFQCFYSSRALRGENKKRDKAKRERCLNKRFC